MSFSPYIEQPLRPGQAPPPSGYVFLGPGPLPEHLQRPSNDGIVDHDWGEVHALLGSTWGRTWQPSDSYYVGANGLWYAIDAESAPAQRFGIRYLDPEKNNQHTIPVTHEF